MTVKRYNLQPDSLMGVTEHPEGSFVHWSDFERALKTALDRNFEAPNGIWSMPHNVESMKRELRELLGSSEQRGVNERG